MDLNRVMLIGNATRAPESKVTPTAQTVCTFGVATNQTWTDAKGVKQQRAEFHNLVAWGKLAEICTQYIAKGMKIYVEGRLQTREWEKDGQKRSRTEIVVDNMILLERKQANAPQPATAPAEQPPASEVPPQDINLSDIPF